MILDGCANWQDASTWPMSTRQVSVVASQPQAGGSTRKVWHRRRVLQGLYRSRRPSRPSSRREAISEDRYAYTLASYRRLVVYENGLFAYSHHGSDPAGQQLRNAFDLVPFGELTATLRSLGGKASYKEMTAWAADLPEVRPQPLWPVDEFETVTGESGEWMAGPT